MWIEDKALKREWKKLRLSLDDKDTNQLLSIMEKNNKDIRSLVGDCSYINSIRPPKTTSNAKRYRDIQNHAKCLYNVLKHHFADSHASSCAAPHTANLILEHRNGAKAVWPKHRKKLSFSIIFSFETSQSSRSIEPPWYWRETEIQPLEFSQSQDQANTRRSARDTDVALGPRATVGSSDASAMIAATGISLAAFGGPKDLDHSFSQSSTSARGAAHAKSSLSARSKKVSFSLTGQSKSQGAASRDLLLSQGVSAPEAQPIQDLCKTMLDAEPASCIGVLVDERERSHRVSITKLSSGKNLIQTVSLQELLAQDLLGKRERLILGVKLASTLLQLINTPWLAESWGNADIRFERKGSGALSAAVDYPLLSKNFVSPPTSQSSSSQAENLAPSANSPNRSLFALGLVLTELWFGKSIDHLREATDLDPQDQTSDLTNFATISRLIETVEHDAGQWYGDAVRRCIHFDITQRLNSLEMETSKEAVHREIMLPLEENLSAFCGGSLERAFG